MDKPIILGLVGLPGAGKTTVAEYLVAKGFVRVTLSDFIREKALKDGVKNLTREVLQEYGNKMREEFGPQVLAQLAHKRIRRENLNKVVIDGIRNLYEIAYLGVENSFALIGIVAKPKVRFERIKIRKDSKLPAGSYEDFLRQEEREESLGSKEIGLRVSECLKKAKYLIRNDTTIRSLEKKIDRIIERISRTEPVDKQSSEASAPDQIAIRVAILGSPGAGKTTQGRMLSVALKIPCLSMGEILRDAYRKGIPEGVEWWETYGRKGLNAPIHLKFPLLVKRLANADNGFILDDFPRTSDDLDALKHFLRLSHVRLDKVILLDINDVTAVNRTMKRFLSNAKRGVARYDDSPYILKIRIKEGYKKELPVIRDFFKQQSLLCTIDGNDGKSITEVHREIVNAVIPKS